MPSKSQFIWRSETAFPYVRFVKKSQKVSGLKRARRRIRDYVTEGISRKRDEFSARRVRWKLSCSKTFVVYLKFIVRINKENLFDLFKFSIVGYESSVGVCRKVGLNAPGQYDRYQETVYLFKKQPPLV